MHDDPAHGWDVAATGGACRHAARNPALRVAAFAERKAYDLLLSIFTLLPANALRAIVASLARRRLL